MPRQNAEFYDFYGYLKQEFGLAVIGIGSMGKKYAAMIDSGKIDGLTLAAVCCRSAENAEWAASSLGHSVRICRTENMLYEDSQSFDAVLVVTPHKLHPTMAIRALQAGKHVMCDKPAGITTADAEAINEAADRSGKKDCAAGRYGTIYCHAA